MTRNLNIFLKSDWIKFALLIGLLYFPLFGHLGSFPLIIYDESRQAMNAFEMKNYGSILIPHFYGNPDIFNSKPPLLIWTQVISMYIFGENDLAVRIPSAVAGLLTCLAIFSFCYYYLKSFWTGFFASLILLTTVGYVTAHGTRTGDYDALVTFFMTISILSIFLFADSKKNKFLHIFFIAISLGVLTKGITIFMFFPAIFIFLLFNREVSSILTNKHFYVGLAYSTTIILGYYLIREQYNPGYIKAVFENEIGGRYLIEQYNHYRGFWFYFDRIINVDYKYWFLTVIPAILVGVLQKNITLRKISILLTLTVISLLLILSFSKTQCEWYIIPIYPLLAIQIGILLNTIIELSNQVNVFRLTFVKNPIPIVLLITVFYNPYTTICKNTIYSNEYAFSQQTNKMGFLLKGIAEKRIDLSHFKIVHDGLLTHLEFYTSIINKENKEIRFSGIDGVQPGDRVIVEQTQLRDTLMKRFELKKIREDWEDISFLEIEKKKNSL